MFEELDPEDFGTEAMFATSDPKSIFVYVEGDTDKVTLEDFFNDMVIVRVFDGKNRKNAVIIAMKEVARSPRKLRKTIGIIDADFNRITGTIKNIDNLFYTDYHDLDVQIFLSEALIKFIKLFMFKPDNVNFKKVRNKCVELANEYGYFLLSFYKNQIYREEFEKWIKNIDYYLQEPNTSFLNKLICSHLKTACKHKLLQKEKYCRIINRIKTLKDKKIHRTLTYDLVNGHDVIRAFSKLILWEKMNLQKKNLSNAYKNLLFNKYKEFERFMRNIENGLRIAYDYDCFLKSELFSKIKEYQISSKVPFLRK